MIATFQQHANLFAALHPAPDQPHETLDAAQPAPTAFERGRRVTVSADADFGDSRDQERFAKVGYRGWVSDYCETDDTVYVLPEGWTWNGVWLVPTDVKVLPTVGSTVSVPKLGLRGVKVVEVVPSRTVGGETRYRVRYYEAAVGAWREYGVWLEDLAVEGE